ncbi:hypothetical protein R3W88_016638 [Solanum pinnatisectum]|uniref:Uncharacterized protein n=1 Tax=Solanum pinnatisectum TaxID=50273 RepID=A0AAV9KXX8_9SOLN|nr:hypothetical protein R3W88_016638 [Solanum pinnatisectum]
MNQNLPPIPDLIDRFIILTWHITWDLTLTLDQKPYSNTRLRSLPKHPTQNSTSNTYLGFLTSKSRIDPKLIRNSRVGSPIKVGGKLRCEVEKEFLKNVFLIIFGASYPSSRQSSLLLSRGKNRNVNFPPRKRICVTNASENFEQRNHPSIEILLDECLFELTLLSSIRKDKIAESNCIEGEGYIVRSLVSREATYVKLAAIAVGAVNYGGLAKLSIRGDNPCHGVSDGGLNSIARCCPTLRDLSLSNVSLVGDESLSEITHGYSCSKIGNKSPKVVGQYYPNLKLIVLKNCPLIGDRRIEDLFYSAGHILTEVELQTLHISDISLKIISQHRTALTSLAVGELRRVIVRDLWVMGIGQCLHKRKALSISACNRVNDLGLHVIYKDCPNLKLFSLVSLHNLQLEECHLITQAGFFGILLNCGKKLKTLSLVKCLGVNDSINAVPSKAPCCNLVVSLTIRNCPRIGNATIVVIGRLCHKLTQIELSGLLCITDEGLFPLVKNSATNLVVVNLSGCVNITDISVSAIVKLNGRSLKFLLVDGYRHITDATLVEIWNSCWKFNVLDVSKCGIINSIIKTLSSAIQLHLQILLLASFLLVSDNSLPF